MQLKNEVLSVNSSLSGFIHKQWMKLKWIRASLSENLSQTITAKPNHSDVLLQLMDNECEQIVAEISEISLKENFICNYITDKCKTASSEELVDLLKVHSFMRSTSKKKLSLSSCDSNRTPEDFANEFTSRIIENIQINNEECSVKPECVSENVITLNSNKNLVNKSTNEPSFPQKYEGERDELYHSYPCPKKSVKYQVYNSFIETPEVETSEDNIDKKSVSLQIENVCKIPGGCACCRSRLQKEKKASKPAEPTPLYQLTMGQQKKYCVPKNYLDLLRERAWEELNFPECQAPECKCQESVYKRKRMKPPEPPPPPPPPPPPVMEEVTEDVCVQATASDMPLPPPKKQPKPKKQKQPKPKKEKKPKPKKQSGGGCFGCCKKKKKVSFVSCEKRQKEVQTECPSSCNAGAITTMTVCNKCGRYVKKSRKRSCPEERCMTSTVIIQPAGVSVQSQGMSSAETSALKSMIKSEANKNYQQMEKILQELQAQRKDLQRLNQMYESIIRALPEDLKPKSNGRKSILSNNSPQIGFCSILELIKLHAYELAEKNKHLCKDLCVNNPLKLFDCGDKQFKNLINESTLVYNCNNINSQSNELPKLSIKDETTTDLKEHQSVLTLFKDTKRNCEQLNSTSDSTDYGQYNQIIVETATVSSEKPSSKVKFEDLKDSNSKKTETENKNEKNEGFMKYPMMVGAWAKQSLNYLIKKCERCPKQCAAKYKPKVKAWLSKTKQDLREYMEKRRAAKATNVATNTPPPSDKAGTSAAYH